MIGMYGTRNFLNPQEDPRNQLMRGNLVSMTPTTYPVNGLEVRPPRLQTSIQQECSNLFPPRSAYHASTNIPPPSPSQNSASMYSDHSDFQAGVRGGVLAGAARSNTLFVGDLSVLCDEQNLFDLFHEFGEIESVQLKKSDSDKQRAHLAYGFIRFRDHQAAARSLEALNGLPFLGRKLRVGWADDHPTNHYANQKYAGSSVPVKKSAATAQVHVSFASSNLAQPISELDLREAFEPFGNLIDVAIKKTVVNPAAEIQSGYGFIHFALTEEGIQSALTAVEQVHRKVIKTISFECTATHGLKTFLFSQRSRSNGSSFHSVSHGNLLNSNNTIMRDVDRMPPTYYANPVAPLPTGNLIAETRSSPITAVSNGYSAPRAPVANALNSYPAANRTVSAFTAGYAIDYRAPRDSPPFYAMNSEVIPTPFQKSHSTSSSNVMNDVAMPSKSMPLFSSQSAESFYHVVPMEQKYHYNFSEGAHHSTDFSLMVDDEQKSSFAPSFVHQD